MTGPEHYREAERLLGQATDNDGDVQTDDRMTTNILAAAQVHATLALAAVTAGQQVRPGKPSADRDAWAAAAIAPEPDYDVTRSVW
ncbi:hypothetical protein ACIQNU_03995 [Streptomyces sp. NPDC091292]|uniref:hypothetical protein n=1 Tax=Streptomyces sp. NPDC091292 TaxID=3365991 RepID=UPI0038119CAE